MSLEGQVYGRSEKEADWLRRWERECCAAMARLQVENPNAFAEAVRELATGPLNQWVCGNCGWTMGSEQLVDEADRDEHPCGPCQSVMDALAGVNEHLPESEAQDAGD